MANILCQIRGTKILALFSPSSALDFKIPPGSSTSPVQVFAHTSQQGRGTIITTTTHNHPPGIKARLNPGDVLYIPPLWLHAAAPIEENLSVSINVFFKSLRSGYAAGRDVYGNRDLQAYENGRRGVEKMVRAFDGLPREIGSAYLERLADELRQKARALRQEERQ